MFGLPGNPVSSRVSFELFARPSLLRMMGHMPLRSAPRSRRAPSTRSRVAVDGKLHLDRVHVRIDDDGHYVVASTGSQESNALAATAAANGLVLLPDGDGVDDGADVRVMLLDP